MRDGGEGVMWHASMMHVEGTEGTGRRQETGSGENGMRLSKSNRVN